MFSYVSFCKEVQGLIERVEKGLEELKKLEKDVRGTTSACNKAKVVGTTATVSGALGACAGILAAVGSFMFLNPALVFAAGCFVSSAGITTNLSAEHIRDTRNRFVSLIFLMFHYYSFSMSP